MIKNNTTANIYPSSSDWRFFFTFVNLHNQMCTGIDKSGKTFRFYRISTLWLLNWYYIVLDLKRKLKGILKFWKLLIKHLLINNKYDLFFISIQTQYWFFFPEIAPWRLLHLHQVHPRIFSSPVMFYKLIL